MRFEEVKPRRMAFELHIFKRICNRENSALLFSCRVLKADYFSPCGMHH